MTDAVSHVKTQERFERNKTKRKEKYLVVYEYRTRHLDVLIGYIEVEAGNIEEAKKSVLSRIGVYKILAVGKIMWKCEKNE